MEKTWEILKLIKREEAPDALFDKIINRIEHKRNRTVPWSWVGVAAAVLILGFSMEFLIVSQSSNSSKHTNQLESLIIVPNNSLYHE